MAEQNKTPSKAIFLWRAATFMFQLIGFLVIAFLVLCAYTVSISSEVKEEAQSTLSALQTSLWPQMGDAMPENVCCGVDYLADVFADITTSPRPGQYLAAIIFISTPFLFCYSYKTALGRKLQEEAHRRIQAEEQTRIAQGLLKDSLSRYFRDAQIQFEQQNILRRRTITPFTEQEHGSDDIDDDYDDTDDAGSVTSGDRDVIKEGAVSE